MEEQISKTLYLLWTQLPLSKENGIIIIVWFKTSTNMMLSSVYIIFLTDQLHREVEKNMENYSDVEDVGKLNIFYIFY
jgi:hypothetical protein